MESTESINNSPTINKPPINEKTLGYKIWESPYRDQVIRIILETRSPTAAQRYLDSKGFHCSRTTIFSFWKNYMTALDPQVMDKAVAEILERERQRMDRLTDEMSHAEVSRYESLVKNIVMVEKQVADWEKRRSEEAALAKDGKTFNASPKDASTLIDLIQLLAKLRKELEETREKSEVEKQRRIAIQEVMVLAIEHMKGKTDKEIREFMMAVSNIVLRRNPEDESGRRST